MSAKKAKFIQDAITDVSRWNGSSAFSRKMQRGFSVQRRLTTLMKRSFDQSDGTLPDRFQHRILLRTAHSQQHSTRKR